MQHNWHPSMQQTFTLGVACGTDAREAHINTGNAIFCCEATFQTSTTSLTQRAPRFDATLRGDDAIFATWMHETGARAFVNPSFLTEPPSRPAFTVAAFRAVVALRQQLAGYQSTELSLRQQLEAPQRDAAAAAELRQECAELQQQYAAEAAARAAEVDARAADKAASDATVAELRRELDGIKLEWVGFALTSQKEQRELRRTEAQQAELSQERRRASAAEHRASAAERRAAAVECELADTRSELDTLRVAPSRAQARCDAEQERRRSEAAAAETIAGLSFELRVALETQRQLESTVRSEQTKRGMEVAVVEAARLAVQQAAELGSKLRNLERREQQRIKELEAARATVAEQRAELERLRVQLPAGRGVERQCRYYDTRSSWVSIRTTEERDDAPFNARTIEYLRRLVDEANISFEGAATANAIVLAMHHGAPAADRLICSKSFQNAFYRGGVLDNEREAAANRACPALWAFASDSQKGTQMMVYFKVRCHPPPALPALISVHSSRTHIQLCPLSPRLAVLFSHTDCRVVRAARSSTT